MTVAIATTAKPVVESELEFDNALVRLETVRPIKPEHANSLSDPTASNPATQPSTDDPIVLPERTTVRSGQSRFEPLQSFEGTVLALCGDRFEARLRDQTDGNKPLEVAEFLVEDVSDDEKDRVCPGAVFYWNIGYRVHSWGQKERSSVIVFRQLPAWSRSDQERARKLEDDWSYMLSGS